MMDQADEALEYIAWRKQRWQEIGNRIKAARKHNQMTQAELADAIGISRPQAANIEGGKFSVTTENLIRICELFGISSDGLLGLTPLKINQTKMELVTLEAKIRKIKEILE